MSRRTHSHHQSRPARSRPAPSCVPPLQSGEFVMNAVRRASCLALLSSLAIAAAFAAEEKPNRLLDGVRTANSRFKDVAVAVAEGYAPIPCASGIDGGAM